MSQVFIFNEKLIDKVFDRMINDDNDPEQELRKLSETQPGIIDFLANESLEVLTPEEHDYLIFLSMVIVNCMSEAKLQLDTVAPEELEELEEKNWELLEAVTGKGFRQRISIFFDHSDQEDMLAFIEDALAEDDLHLVTKEGRELMFIVLLTLFQALILNIE